MNLNLTKEIYECVCSTHCLRSHFIPEEEAIVDHIIHAAEQDNEMAIVFLAEWFYLAEKQNISTSKKRLSPFFAG